MKRFFSLLLCCCALLSGCSRLEPMTDPGPVKVTEEVKKPSSKAEANAKNCYGVPIYIHENEYQTIEDGAPGEIMGRRLTWENINAFPIKSADMSAMELRMLCVNFFQFAKTSALTPGRAISCVSMARERSLVYTRSNL